ncbi:response regulator [Winogradskyella sp. 3972H.M.0a.05]|uniref:response regulator n=1 Tax=Winogradskyella sp. 3972H.M.0a.05 TaxID=2950277 RepID=UPI003391058F
MKKEASIVIADDHPMLLKGLYDELTSNGYNIIGQADNGMRALELILTLKPKLALLDIEMPLLNAFEVFKMAREKRTETKFILLSYHKEKEYILQARALNIGAYLLKEDSFFTIEKCIESVLNNEEFFSPYFQDSALSNTKDELKQLSHLTASEVSILKRIALNQSSKAIADDIGVSIRTIDKHRANIINKLGLSKSTNTLTSWALLNKDIIGEL